MLENYWVPVGRLLGIDIMVDGKRETLWWRVRGREHADYTYAFASTARSAATNWIDLQDAQNNYILNPTRTDIINQFYVGINQSRMIMFMQYPTNIDKNSLVATRAVDANALGGITGDESPFLAPARKTEFFTLFNLRPALRMFNDTPVTDTPRIRLYAMKYAVEGPYVEGDPIVGTGEYLRQLAYEGKAKLTSIYGVDPANLPIDFVSKLTESRKRAEGNGNGNGIASARALARF